MSRANNRESCSRLLGHVIPIRLDSKESAARVMRIISRVLLYANYLLDPYLTVALRFCCSAVISSNMATKEDVSELRHRVTRKWIGIYQQTFPVVIQVPILDRSVPSISSGGSESDMISVVCDTIQVAHHWISNSKETARS
jgi:hypothetical protein